jgi:hypothetical protein
MYFGIRLRHFRIEGLFFIPKMPKQKSSNFIIRKPLLAYFVLSNTFFWGFLVLIYRHSWYVAVTARCIASMGDADNCYSRFLDAQSRCCDRDGCYRRS